ncbi:MAG: tandem-95 repeat protein, partial [Anaerolineae bacterium]
DEDTAVLVDVLANDSDPNGHTVLLASAGAPAHGTTTIVGQDVRYTPAPDYNGSDVFTYVASDGWLTGTGTVTVTIMPVNDAPSFTKGADQTVAEDSGQHVVANWATDILPGPATATDEAGQVLTFTLTSADGTLFSQPPTVDAAGTLTFTPAADAFGSTVVTATLQDSGGTANGGVDASAQTFAITVTNVNDAPVAVSTAITTPEDTAVTLAAAQLATDVDGDALTVVAAGVPASGATSVIGGALVYTPALNLSYTEAFTFTVVDPADARDTATLTVTVTPLNDAPTLDPVADIAVNEDAPAQVVALSGITSGAPDEMQTLTVTASSQNTTLIPHPAVTYASPDTTGNLTFTPAANRYGSARIDVTVSDGISQTTRSFTVTVAAVNDPPTLNPLADLELYPDAGQQTVNLSGIRAGPYESQVLTVTASSTNTALIPTPAVTYASPNTTGSLTFTPVAGQSGTATVAVTVTDGLSATVRTFLVTVFAPPSLLAYVAAGEAGLLIVDVSIPTKPRLTSTYDTPGFARSVALSGTLAYVADCYHGLRIVDVSDPTAPQPAGDYNTQGYANDVAIFGHYAYVADITYGLQIIDVAYPAAPQVAGQYRPSGVSIMGVIVAASDPPGHLYAYLTTRVQGLLIVDVTDPANPHFVGRASIGYGRDVEVHDSYAYVTGGIDGLRLVDVTDPANPQTIARANTPGIARGFDVAGSYATIADESTGLQVVDLNPPSAPQATACDRYGQCTTVTATQIQAADAPSRITQADGPTVDFLGAPIVLDSTDPTSVTVSATSPASLRALTVTLDAAPFHAETWASGAVTEAVRTLDWTPSTEGAHVFSAIVADWSGGVASTTITITVDTSPPALGITPTVLIGTHFHAPRTLDLTGWVSDTGGAASITGMFGDVAYAAGIEGDTWHAPVYLGQDALPDGAPTNVTARAVDVAGHATLITESVLVDLVPPSPITLTLSHDGTPLASGTTIRAVSPTLALAWTPASDGSGLAHYSVDWTTATALTTTHAITQIAPVAPRLAEHVAGEAQQLTVQLTSQDVHGNAQSQTFGPVYVDSPLTPDYIELPVDTQSDAYRGWMDSGCAMVGVDRRASRGASGQAALGTEQRFHVTWNEQALRLTWTGANWDTPATGAAENSSDLFIYLDVRAGGAITAVNPYAGDGPVIYLPGATPSSQTGAMGADYLVWVWNTDTAVLLEWTGSEWDLAATLTPAEYRFDASTGGGLTDLYLPFAMIGIADPVSATLDMVAFASGQATLDLWAVMPPDNPANSALVVETTDDPTTQNFALSHSYHWDSLGAGICPNGSDGSTPTPYIDADVQVHATVDPAGTVYSYLDDGLFWLWELLLGDRLSDITSQFATGHPRVGDGQTLTYTLEFQNEGTVTATNVFADVAAHFALRLPDGDVPDLVHQIVPLGDLAPGETRSVTFRGRADAAYCENTLLLGDDCGWAVADILIHDNAHPSGTSLERVWIDHQVDADGPRFFGIQDPAYLIPAGENGLRGYAYDPAGVPEIAVEVQGGSTLVCPDATPDDGQWSCAWDTSGYNDGDLIDARLQASDGVGQASAWSDWLPFRVDARPPSVTLDVTATAVVSGSLVNDSAFALVGDIADDGGVAEVQVCTDDACGQAALLNTDTSMPTTVSLDDVPAAPVAINAATACGGGEIVRAFAVAESFAIGDVGFGFNADHAHRDDIRVTLQSPAGTSVVVLDDDGLSGTTFQNYDVLLNDAAVTGMDDASGDDDPAAPYFDRTSRPASPLRAFLGEDAAGTWTLRICDLNPNADDGAYRRSRLILSPRFTAAQTGRWSYQTPSVTGLDYVSRTVTIAGTDTVGNTGDPLRLAVTVDNVAPAVTVSMVTTTITPTFSTRVISGTVSDGSGSSVVFVSVKTPTGKVYQEAALRDGNAWAYDLGAVFPGHYVLWVSASDDAGNVTTKGPYNVTVASWLSEINYLPLIMQNW